MAHTSFPAVFRSRSSYHLHFSNEKTEAQRGQVTCSRAHSFKVAKQRNPLMKKKKKKSSDVLKKTFTFLIHAESFDGLLWGTHTHIYKHVHTHSRVMS